jgi:hypothetical protein
VPGIRHVDWRCSGRPQVSFPFDTLSAAPCPPSGRHVFLIGEVQASRTDVTSVRADMNAPASASITSWTQESSSA